MNLGKIINKIKENFFIFAVLIVYIVMLIFKYQMGINSIKNSLYYIKEMIFIMPVIFVLTALLDTWVPKEKIIKFLGKDAKIIGVILSFVVGSISAGPIYAAFPMCIMLHKKGAGIKNIVIILSSWAVIKVPMLLNEVKFLGFKFMLLRWILTVIAIIVFATICERVVKDKDIPNLNIEDNNLYILEKSCMGCSLCVKNYPELFEMVNKKASINPVENVDEEKLKNAITNCPVNAICNNIDV